MPTEITGQLNSEERRLLTAAITEAPVKPQVVIEVGTWLGGGSTLHFLRALEMNGAGHLWGVEADRSIYERMIANIRAAAPEAVHRFTPLFGFSQQVIPQWLQEIGPDRQIDVAFLDGGDNPMEQITEFQLLDPRIPVGGRLLSHDAKLRKGKWFRPYIQLLDHWQVTLHDVSAEGLLEAVKLRPNPSRESQQAADAMLRQARRQLTELVGRYLPSAVCEMLLQMMPEKLRKRISQGR